MHDGSSNYRKKYGTHPLSRGSTRFQASIFYVGYILGVIDVINIETQRKQDQNRIGCGITAKTAYGFYPHHGEHNQIYDGHKKQNGPPPGAVDNLHQNHGIVDRHGCFPGFSTCYLV